MAAFKKMHWQYHFVKNEFRNLHKVVLSVAK